MAILQDLTGNQYTRLKVVERAPRTKNGSARWICKCACGNTVEVGSKELRYGHTKSCGCLRRARGSESNKWTGCGEISGETWYGIQYTAAGRRRSSKTAVDFTVTIEDMWQLFLEQDRCCALTGLPLHFVSRKSRSLGEQTASLDRIDSSCGYIPGNMQWVHKDINLMKNTLSQKRFIQMCALVTKYCGS